MSPHDAARGALWRIDQGQPVVQQADAHGHTPRTEQLTHEVAVVEHVPIDAQNLGLTDLTAPGLAMAASLNPHNPRQKRLARWWLALMVLPARVVTGLAIVPG